MINLPDYIADSHLYRTLQVDDLLLVKYECFENEKRSEIWSHTNYLAYVLGGRKKWKTPHQAYTVSSGEALFIKKGANTVYQYFEDPFFVLFVFIPDNYISRFLRQHASLFPRHKNHYSGQHDLIPIDQNKVHQSFFHSLTTYFSEDAQVSKPLLKLKVEELLLNLLTQPGNQLLKSYLAGLGQSQKAALEEIMQAHYFQPFNISDYARLCARSLASFRRDFQNVFHSTPGRWLMKKRLEHARFLLETTDQLVTEVSDNSGFKNRSHFVRSFKAAYGYPPSRYRTLEAETTG